MPAKLTQFPQALPPLDRTASKRRVSGIVRLDFFHKTVTARIFAKFRTA